MVKMKKKNKKNKYFFRLIYANTTNHNSFVKKLDT